LIYGLGFAQVALGGVVSAGSRASEAFTNISCFYVFEKMEKKIGI